VTTCILKQTKQAAERQQLFDLVWGKNLRFLSIVDSDDEKIFYLLVNIGKT